MIFPFSGRSFFISQYKSDIYFDKKFASWIITDNYHCLKNSSVPLNGPNRNKWIKAIEQYQPFVYVPSYYVCSLHFSQEDIKINGNRKNVVPGRVPSIFPNSKNFRNFDAKSDSANSLQTTINCETMNKIASCFADDEGETQILGSNKASDVATDSTFKISTSHRFVDENEELISMSSGNNWGSDEIDNIEVLDENSSDSNNYELSDSPTSHSTYQIPE